MHRVRICLWSVYTRSRLAATEGYAVVDSLSAFRGGMRSVSKCANIIEHKWSTVCCCLRKIVRFMTPHSTVCGARAVTLIPHSTVCGARAVTLKT